MLVYTTPGTWNYTVQVDHFAGDLAPSGLTVNMWGVTNFPQNPDHHVVSAFNGQVVADDSFDGLAEYVVEAELPAGLVQEGANTLALTLPGDTGVPYDLVNLEGYSLTYPRAFVARNGALQYSANAKMFRVTDLPTNSVVAYRLEDGVLSRINYIQVKPAGGTFYAEFRGSLVPAQYIVFSADALLTPAISPAAPVEDITSTPADYLIISHPDFIGGLTDLVAARQAQGLVVKVVNVETLYNQYSFGILDPQAIRDYIAYAVNNMGTEAVLLVGADNYDYHHYLYPNAISFIPTLYAATDPFIVSYAPVDPLFADVNYDNVPDAALGRFPVRTSDELAAVISKTLAYEVKDYGETAVFVADKKDGEVSFAGVSTGFLNRLPDSWSTTNLFLDEMDVSAARPALIDRINLGVAFVNYAGHSSSTLWSAQQVFTNSDAAALLNVGRPTVVSQWGCWNSYFVSPAANTLAHNLLLSGDRGAAAVIGSTTLTRISSETALGDLMVPLMAQPGMTIGQAFQMAKAEMAQSQIEGSLDALLGLTLLGDPMLIITPITP
jgi:hypothetical protein